MGVQGPLLPSTPRFNHPTDCLQLRAPKFLLSLFSPPFLSLVSSAPFPPSTFCCVFIFPFLLSLSRVVDRSSTRVPLESAPADTNAVHCGSVSLDILVEKIARFCAVARRDKEGKKRESMGIKNGSARVSRFGAPSNRIRSTSRVAFNFQPLAKNPREIFHFAFYRHAICI